MGYKINLLITAYSGAGETAGFPVSTTGGPDVYERKNMLDTHRGMNVDEAEFMAVVGSLHDAQEQ